MMCQFNNGPFDGWAWLINFQHGPHGTGLTKLPILDIKAHKFWQSMSVAQQKLSHQEVRWGGACTSPLSDVVSTPSGSLTKKLL